MDWRKIFIYRLYDSNETSIYVSKYRVEAYPQVKGKEGHSLSYHVLKVPIVLQNIDFWFFKVTFSKRTQLKKKYFWEFYETNFSEPGISF